MQPNEGLRKRFLIFIEFFKFFLNFHFKTWSENQESSLPGLNKSLLSLNTGVTYLKINQSMTLRSTELQFQFNSEAHQALFVKDRILIGKTET